MKLLFDENLAPRLASDLQDLFPGSLHVRSVGLSSANDTAVWRYAAENNLTIITKDDDFRQRNLLYGSPPKVIGVLVGNCSTVQVEKLIREHHLDLESFEADEQGAYFALVIRKTG